MLEFIGEHVQEELAILGERERGRRYAGGVDAAEVAEQFRTEIVAVDEIAVVGEGNAVPV